MKRTILAGLAALLAVPALAQSPRISALFPAGAKVGQTVEVAVRGGNLVGAKRVFVIGADGVSAQLNASDSAVDESAKPVFQQKCQLCHELRSPGNRSMTPEQWAATVDRMINARSAPIAQPERDKIVGYLQALARAGQITARVQVAPDAVPGTREVRIVTDRGVSTAFPFEVGTLAEIVAQSGTSAKEPQKVTLPVVVNGALSTSGQRDYFAFDAQKGQRLTFNLKGFRLSEASQTFFNPTLTLSDASGKVVAKNSGRFDLDPLIDIVIPADGTYTLLVRDLLWRGSPASVYRLAMGALPYDAALFPAAGRPGATLTVTMTGSIGAGQSVPIRVPAGAEGVIPMQTPLGDAPFLVRDLPDGGGPVGRNGGAVPTPALFRSRLTQTAQIDTFVVQIARGGTGLELYARRLGVPLRARVRILNDKGREIRTQTAEGQDDLRMAGAFGSPGTYLIEVSNADDAASGTTPNLPYYLEVGGSGPDFALQVTPDNPNIGPGGTLAMLVRATRRQGMRGAITIRVQNLPLGVTASPAVIPPEDDKVVVTLTASPNASPDARLVRVEGIVSEEGATVTRAARPFETYLINNNPRLTARTSLTVAVSSAPQPYRLIAASDSVALQPGQEARVTVRLERASDFRNDVQVSVLGLPPGISASPGVVNLGGNQTEATLTLRANNNANFLKQRPFPGLPPLRVVLTGTSGDLIYSTTPILLTGQNASDKP